MCNSVRRNFAHRWVAFSRIGKHFVGGCLAPIMPHSCRCRALGKTTLGRMPSKLRVRRVLQSKDSATSNFWPRFTLLTMAFSSCKINPSTGMNVANRISARRCYFQNCQASVCDASGAASFEKAPVMRFFCVQICNWHFCFYSS